MTAIAALWDYGGGDPAPVLDRMLAAQAIYGRETASAARGPVAFGRRLWPLVPEDAFDTGPIVGKDGTFMLVVDARIDNRAELGVALGLTPERLSGMSDADVALAVIEYWDNSDV